jgi:lysozyme
MLPESIAQLKAFEGLRLKPYTDTTGHLSIGWGRNLDSRGISHEEATILLTTDLNIAESQARDNFPWIEGLDPVRQDFIVMMIFNIGLARLKGFKNMLAAIEAHDWGKAGAELVDSTWSKQVGAIRSASMRKAIEFGAWE